MGLPFPHLCQKAAEMAALAAGQPGLRAMKKALKRTYYDDLPDMLEGSRRIGHGGYAEVYALPRNMGVMKVGW
jgi:hypothetical protein